MTIFDQKYIAFNHRPETLAPEKWQELWGVCNWQNRGDYPKKEDDLTPDQWRWEFLRRDPGYREAYYAYAHGYCDVEEGGVEEKAKVSVFRHIEYGLVELIDPRTIFAKLPENFCFDRYPIVLRSEDKSFALNFPNAEMDDDFRTLLEIDEPFTVDVRFDLRRPIAFQREVIKARLETLQENLLNRIKRSRGSDDLIEGLRILDAHQAGASNEEIWDYFFDALEDKYRKSTKTCQAIDQVKNLWQKL